LDVPGVGVDHSGARIRRAEALAADARDSRVRFEMRDVLADPPDIGCGDLLVGLHACGELGDALVTLAAERRARPAGVSCCLQKTRSAVRQPVSRAGVSAGLVLSRAALGLSNLAARAEGVEVSLEATLRARETRCAVLLLLRARGLAVAWGD